MFLRCDILRSMIGPLVLAALLPHSPKVTIDQLGWMAGSWSCPFGKGTYEEHWLSPKDSMQGTARRIVGGKTVEMEFMSIESAPDGLTMWVLLGNPSKGEKRGFPFRLTTFDGRSAVFENPKNDFPNRIVYRKDGKSAMICWIEGTEGDKKSRLEFPFKRQR